MCTMKNASLTECSQVCSEMHLADVSSNKEPDDPCSPTCAEDSEDAEADPSLGDQGFPIADSNGRTPHLLADSLDSQVVKDAVMCPVFPLSSVPIFHVTTVPASPALSPSSLRHTPSHSPYTFSF